MSASPSDRVFIDTNVWVCAQDTADRRKQSAAKQRLREERRTSEVVISTQVLQELYASLTRGTRPILPADAAEEAVRDLTDLTVVQIDAARILEAIGQSQRSKLSFWDALIVRAAVAGGCGRLLSEDLNHGQVIEGVQVENPFL